ncbi:lytic transglycosylase domain-containing protein [Inhella crocodyli]|uniref:Lytic transglycosylase domain-containing protein n=1 Tax=Inhella crocodyli TaxID=2499851 RepID=A0A437LRI1_9BURK|nr:lytic transglycosylase domain-containing protein [Inhella crocodyli]
MRPTHSLRTKLRQLGSGFSVFAKDVGQGLLLVSHNTLALLGLLLLSLLVAFTSQPQWRERVEHQAFAWLAERASARAEREGDSLALASDPDAVTRATFAEAETLSAQQRQVAQWLSRKYKVAPEAMNRLVLEAWEAGRLARVEPTLVLAVMAVESGFNPFAQSPVGAQGLMQVMTHVHDDKYEAFGGQRAALDPVTNLRVGVQVLRECIQRAGGVAEGLRYYVGAANMADDGGYAAKVLFEADQLKAVLAGKRPPMAAPSAPTALREAVAPAPSASEAADHVALWKP